ncbi:MAG: hypothetical protein WCE68_12330 [Anaerolineales bacterium]
MENREGCASMGSHLAAVDLAFAGLDPGIYRPDQGAKCRNTGFRV